MEGAILEWMKKTREGWWCTSVSNKDLRATHRDSARRQREAVAERKSKKRIGAPANLVPRVGSVASESNESLVTLREEITAEGSLDFHGSWCGRLVFSGEVSENDLKETLLGLRSAWCREWRMQQDLFSGNVCMFVWWRSFQCMLGISFIK